MQDKQHEHEQCSSGCSPSLSRPMWMAANRARQPCSAPIVSSNMAASRPTDSQSIAKKEASWVHLGNQGLALYPLITSTPPTYTSFDVRLVLLKLRR
eukprot:1160033-Pelagomonas_calceolata.AAC.5